MIKKIKMNKSVAFKEACLQYQMEQDKSGKKSAQYFCDQVGIKYNTLISARTVQHYVKNDLAGNSPQKHGPDGGLSCDDFKILVAAYKSYIQIKQINAETSGNNQKLLAQRINNTVKNDSKSDRLFQQLQKESTIDFKACVSNPQEESRQRWTNYSNINCWFVNWEAFLVEYGFGTSENGKVNVSNAQKKRILNLDESACSMDGSAQKKGGRPIVTFYDGSLQVLGVITLKTSQSTTLITGSSAVGEVLLLHFQFSTKAKSVEQE